jgi:hypothetical protein
MRCRGNTSTGAVATSCTHALVALVACIVARIEACIDACIAAGLTSIEPRIKFRASRMRIAGFRSGQQLSTRGYVDDLQECLQLVLVVFLVLKQRHRKRQRLYSFYSCWYDLYWSKNQIPHPSNANWGTPLVSAAIIARLDDSLQSQQNAEFGSADEASGYAETDMRLPSDLLRRDGFVVRPPLASADHMTRLASIMNRLESSGRPPVFCFMNGAVWDFAAASVWPVVRSLLGVDCVLDSGSAFAWSLKATGKSTFSRDGEFRSW